MSPFDPYLAAVLLAFVLAFVLVFWRPCSRRGRDAETFGATQHLSEPYGYLGRGWPDEVCLDDARRHCDLPDGSLGKCVMNGVCAPAFHSPV